MWDAWDALTLTLRTGTRKSFPSVCLGVRAGVMCIELAQSCQASRWALRSEGPVLGLTLCGCQREVPNSY